MENYNELKKLATTYLKARSEFLEATKEINDLSGNDNIVGRIGELIALQFLRSRGRIVVKNCSAVEKGYDLECSKGNKISVKIITAENKSGRTTAIKKPWTELIVIKLGSDYKVEKLGYITDARFDEALAAGIVKKEEPICSTSLLKPYALFHIYGELIEQKDLLELL